RPCEPNAPENEIRTGALQTGGPKRGASSSRYLCHLLGQIWSRRDQRRVYGPVQLPQIGLHCPVDVSDAPHGITPTCAGVSDRSALGAAPATLHGSVQIHFSTEFLAGVLGERVIWHRACPESPVPGEASLAILAFPAGHSWVT